jgi:cytidylate kinase
MSGQNNYVITIARQFGSLGRPIAQLMAEKLGIEYYDRDIVEQAAQKLNLPVSKIDEIEESAKKTSKNSFKRMMYPLGTQASTAQDKVFEAQKNIMKFLTEKESCIIVGRCSDFVLSDVENAVHIYIYAPYEARVKNCVEELHLEEAEAKKMIKSVDEARDTYHMHYAGFLPNDQRFKQIMIDSSLLGVEGTADFLVDAVKKKFDL